MKLKANKHVNRTILCYMLLCISLRYILHKITPQKTADCMGVRRYVNKGHEIHVTITLIILFLCSSPLVFAELIASEKIIEQSEQIIQNSKRTITISNNIISQAREKLVFLKQQLVVLDYEKQRLDFRKQCADDERPSKCYYLKTRPGHTQWNAIMDKISEETNIITAEQDKILAEQDKIILQQVSDIRGMLKTDNKSEHE